MSARTEVSELADKAVRAPAALAQGPNAQQNTVEAALNRGAAVLGHSRAAKFERFPESERACTSWLCCARGRARAGLWEGRRSPPGQAARELHDPILARRLRACTLVGSQPFIAPQHAQYIDTLRSAAASPARPSFPAMKFISFLAALSLVGASTVSAWDYEGHRVVNLLAVDALTSSFPGFVRTPQARERIAFLSGEADRWRNTPELSLKHFNAPDHFIDLEELPDFDLTTGTLPPFRYEFTARLATARVLHPARFASIPHETNADHTKELVGFLPWTITEYYGKLKSGFSYLKAYQENGTPDEIANAQANIIYIMGVMGHFVGDAGQPLHTTKHFNGWVGPNPAGYATNRTIHAWIDGGYFAKTGALESGDLKSRMRPSQALWSGRSQHVTNHFVFARTVEFIAAQHQMVEPLYRLDKAGKLSSEGTPSKEGIEFFHGQLVVSAQFLADLWHSAWVDAPPDTYLKTKLAQRKAKAEPHSGQ